ncbi:MAG: helix-turn-helix domain-containing protein [Lachnospiraceae bacterium]
MDATRQAEFGARLRKQREYLNLTREAFAEKVNLSPQFIAEIELGKKGLSLDTLIRICEYFNLSADYLLFGKTEAAANTPLNSILKDLPSSYLSTAENMLELLRDTIETAAATKNK